MDQRKQTLSGQALSGQALKRALKGAAAGAALALAGVSPSMAQIVIGGDSGSSVTVNLDVIDGRPGGRLTTPGSDGRILLMPNAPREGQERIVLKPPASMRGAKSAAPSTASAAMAAASQLTPPAAMRSGTSRLATPPAMPSASTPAPSAPAVRAPTVLQPEKPTPPKVAAPKPTETPKPAAPVAGTEKPARATQRSAALPSAKPEPVTPPAATASKAEPQAEPKAAPKPAEQRVAALPPKDSAASQPAPAGVTRLSFGFNQAEMDQAAREGLQTIAKRLQDNESLRVQLLAYAGGEGMSSSQARRLSLSRALAVRSYLIEQGIRSTRMDVRALGNTGKDGPADRVDIRIIDR